MVRNEKERLDTWITREGPLATISGGIWLRGQFSMLIICRLLQRTSSYGRLWSSWLSLIYRDSRFSSVPVIRFNKVIKQNIFPSAPRCSNLVLDILSGTHGTVTLCFDSHYFVLHHYFGRSSISYLFQQEERSDYFLQRQDIPIWTGN